MPISSDDRRHPQLLSMLGLAVSERATAEGLAACCNMPVPDATITVTEFHPYGFS